MRYKDPLKQILVSTRTFWDRPETRPAVRKNFEKVISCRTLALGAEVYASETEEKLVYHTCKSRACPSCGHRATLLWQREQWASLPDIPYAGVVLTMPDVLWPIFRQNRHLLHDLPALGAAAIQHWLKAKYGVSVLVIAVQHTFGRHLTFNSHLHMLVSAAGLQESECRWIAPLDFDKRELMRLWRYAIIAYLLAALKARVLTSDLRAERIKAVLTMQYHCRWYIYVDKFTSKWHFLQYAGRYVRRPPIAQHRFERITDAEVRFWTKDLRLRQTVLTRYSLQEFVTTLADHVPDHYRHSIRYFGLQSAASKHRTSAALFAILDQRKRRRPPRLSWANSIWKYFRVDPLIDSGGLPMRWINRLSPAES